MLPEKRRRGRAIRKRRRESRERIRRVEEAYARLQVAIRKTFPQAAEAMAKAFTNLAHALATPPRRNHYALTSSQGAAERSEAGMGDPSHSGVQRGREAHSASRGPDIQMAIYDEPWRFGEEYDDDERTL